MWRPALRLPMPEAAWLSPPRVVLGVATGFLLLLAPGVWLAAQAPVSATGVPFSAGPVDPELVVAKGQPAPDFVLPGLDARPVRLSDFRGRVVMLNFWASWCVPCKVEMPGMEAVYQDLKGQGFVVLAVNMQDDPDVARRFVEEVKATFPIALDRDGSVARQYRLAALPTSFFIDREGRVADINTGLVTRGQVEFKATRLLEAPPS